MDKKAILQWSASLAAALWLGLSGCAGASGGSGCGMGANSSTGCSGSPPQCVSGFTAQCQTSSNTGVTQYVCEAN